MVGGVGRACGGSRPWGAGWARAAHLPTHGALEPVAATQRLTHILPLHVLALKHVRTPEDAILVGVLLCRLARVDGHERVLVGVVRVLALVAKRAEHSSKLPFPLGLQWARRGRGGRARDADLSAGHRHRLLFRLLWLRHLRRRLLLRPRHRRRRLLLLQLRCRCLLRRRRLPHRGHRNRLLLLLLWLRHLRLRRRLRLQLRLRRNRQRCLLLRLRHRKRLLRWRRLWHWRRRLLCRQQAQFLCSSRHRTFLVTTVAAVVMAVSGSAPAKVLYEQRTN